MFGPEDKKPIGKEEEDSKDTSDAGREASELRKLSKQGWGAMSSSLGGGQSPVNMDIGGSPRKHEDGGKGRLGTGSAGIPGAKEGSHLTEADRQEIEESADRKNYPDGTRQGSDQHEE